MKAVLRAGVDVCADVAGAPALLDAGPSIGAEADVDALPTLEAVTEVVEVTSAVNGTPAELVLPVADGVEVDPAAVIAVVVDVVLGVELGGADETEVVGAIVADVEGLFGSSVGVVTAPVGVLEVALIEVLAVDVDEVDDVVIDNVIEFTVEAVAMADREVDNVDVIFVDVLPVVEVVVAVKLVS